MNTRRSAIRAVKHKFNCSKIPCPCRAATALCLWAVLLISGGCAGAPEANQSRPLWEDSAKNPALVLEKSTPLPDRHQLCRELIRLGHFQVAQTQLEELLAQGENSPQTHYLAGVCQRELKLYQAAEKSFKTALRASPQFAPAFNGLGLLYHDTNRPEEAENLFQEAVSHDPARADFCNNLGFFYMTRGEFSRAAEHFRTCLKLDPGYAVAVNNLSICLAIEDPKASLSLLRKYLSSAEAANNMGAVLQLTGRPQEAVEMYQKALELKPDLSTARSNLSNMEKVQMSP